jgi:hypothetical protein
MRDPRAMLWAELEALAASWRAEAAILRKRAGGPMAELLEGCADELAERLAVRATEAELLTLEEAAEESGYSYSGIHKLVTGGKLPNYGGPHRPRVRRGDVLRFAKRAKGPPSMPDPQAGDITAA